MSVTDSVAAAIADATEQWRVAGTKQARFVVNDDESVVENIETQKKKENVVDVIIQHLFKPTTTHLVPRTEEWYARRAQVLSGTPLYTKCSDCKAFHRLQPNGELFWEVFEADFRGKEHTINRFQCPKCLPATEAELRGKIQGAKTLITKTRNPDSVKRSKEAIKKMEYYISLIETNKANSACFAVEKEQPVLESVKVFECADVRILANISNEELSLRTPYGETLLHFVSSESKTIEEHSALKVVMVRLASLVGVDATNAIGQTALHYATRRGDLATVTNLIALGADETIKCSNGSTMLHYAVLSGRQSLVSRFMYQFGTNKDGETPLDYAVTTPHYDVLRLMLTQHEPTRLTLSCATAVSNNTAITILVESGFPLNGEVMVKAASLGHVSTVVLFLDKGVPIDSVDATGRTALIWACINGDDRLFVTLLAKNPNTDVIDSWGSKAIHYVRKEYMGRVLVGEEFNRTVLKPALRREAYEEGEYCGRLAVDEEAAVDEETMYQEWLSHLQEEQSMVEATRFQE